MNITIFSIGSRGDVEPFAAIGSGLAALGHDVQIVASDNFEPLARRAGIRFVSLGGDTRAMLDSPEGRRLYGTDRNALALARAMRKLGGERLKHAMKVGLDACRETDLIVGTAMAIFPAHAVAEKLGLPFVQGYHAPIHATGEFSAPFVSTMRQGGALFNSLTHGVARGIFGQLFRSVINEGRRDLLGLPDTGWRGLLHQLQREQLPVFYTFSSAVIPKPSEWGEFIHITGYPQLPEPRWEPPAALEAFLEAGPPPVYVGFGSMVDSDPEKLTALVLAALARAGQCGVINSSWNGLKASALPSTVFAIDDAPHSWLFPRMSAVVHHGGSGTTGAGLRAGRPTLVVPFVADQFFWASRVHAMGAGPSPIVRKKLTVEGLAAAITQAVEVASYRERAQAIAAQIANEDGVAEGARCIARYLPREPRARSVAT